MPSAATALDRGDTAWMLTSTALVLMMTVPGLALFYAGMVRKMNLLNTMAQSFGVTCLVTVLWMVIGYSLAFTGSGSFVGSLDRVMLNGMAIGGASPLAPTIPESVYMCFQMTFAIITPALMTGRGGGPGQVLGHHGLLRAVAGLRLRPHRPYGLGRRVPRQLGRSRLRGWNRGAYQRRRRRAGRLPRRRAAQGLWQDALPPQQRRPTA